jgi:glycosyltransferase involved in cell wall biosynthesis
MIKVLFLIQDTSFVYDNRIRREATTLREVGMEVTVICPKFPGESWHDVTDGIHVYRYMIPTLGSSVMAHLPEYIISLISLTVLTFWVALRHGFDVIHVANPPDFLWVVAAPYRLLLGKRFVFDHHDLVPELYQDRFGTSHSRVLTVLRFLERMSFRLAHHVISTNESYRAVAMSRGGKRPDEVTVVRNGPASDDFPDGTPDPTIRALGRIVVGYLGNMNPQDGVDRFLEMARLLRQKHHRMDIGFVMIGKGDSFEDLVQLREKFGLTDAVAMTGRLPWVDVIASLRSTDICVQPDPPGLLNNHSTMNKLMEYMSLGRAVVSYDLAETRVSGGDAVFYVQGSGAEDLASAVMALADNPDRMRQLQRAGQERVRDVLSWDHQSPRLVEVYEKLFPSSAPLRNERHAARASAWPRIELRSSAGAGSEVERKSESAV